MTRQLHLFDPPPSNLEGVISYASGLSTPGEIVGFSDLGWNVGVTAGNCSSRCIDALIRIPSSVRVMLDSGAVKEVDRKSGELRRAMTPKVWENRLDFYDKVVELIGGERVMVVGPDRIRSQAITLERVKRYAHRMRRLQRRGCDVMAVLQPGPIGLAEFYRQISRRLGFSALPAFPMGARETDLGLMAACLRELRPKRCHFLGQGPRSGYLPTILRAAKGASPGTVHSCDSYPLRAVKGYRSDRSPKPYTERELEAMDDIRFEAWTGGSEGAFGVPFDSTEDFVSLNEWTDLVVRSEIAKKVGMNDKDTIAFLIDPYGLIDGLEERIEEHGVDFDPRSLYYEIEEAWARYVQSMTRDERHHRAVTRSMESL